MRDVLGISGRWGLVTWLIAALIVVGAALTLFGTGWIPVERLEAGPDRLLGLSILVAGLISGALLILDNRRLAKQNEESGMIFDPWMLDDEE